MSTDHDVDAVVELLPCPFCGDTMDSFAGMTVDAFGKCSDGTLLVGCDCGATGPTAPTMVGAVAAWNRRQCSHKPGDRLPGGLVVKREGIGAELFAKYVTHGDGD